jgi:hypothetical protein
VTTTATVTATVTATDPPIRVIREYSRPILPPPPVRNLSRGNIFLGAFYKTDDDDDDGDGDGDGGGGGGGGGGGSGVGITSALVDNCDRVYDKLYK